MPLIQACIVYFTDIDANSSETQKLPKEFILSSQRWMRHWYFVSDPTFESKIANDDWDTVKIISLIEEKTEKLFDDPKFVKDLKIQLQDYIKYLKLSKRSDKMKILNMEEPTFYGSSYAEMLTYSHLANKFRSNGEHDSSAKFNERGLAIARDLKDEKNQTIFLSNSAINKIDQGDFEAALEFINMSLALNESPESSATTKPPDVRAAFCSSPGRVRPPNCCKQAFTLKTPKSTYL